VYGIDNIVTAGRRNRLPFVASIRLTAAPGLNYRAWRNAGQEAEDDGELVVEPPLDLVGFPTACGATLERVRQDADGWRHLRRPLHQVSVDVGRFGPSVDELPIEIGKALLPLAEIRLLFRAGVRAVARVPLTAQNATPAAYHCPPPSLESAAAEGYRRLPEWRRPEHGPSEADQRGWHPTPGGVLASGSIFKNHEAAEAEPQRLQLSVRQNLTWESRPSGPVRCCAARRLAPPPTSDSSTRW
jgi:hypothetical protein